MQYEEEELSRTRKRKADDIINNQNPQINSPDHIMCSGDLTNVIRPNTSIVYVRIDPSDISLVRALLLYYFLFSFSFEDEITKY